MIEVKNHTDLAKIIDLCRKKGVEVIKLDGIELKLREEAPPSNYKKKNSDAPTDHVPVEDQFTEEQLLMWSASETFEEGAVSGENNT